MVRKILLYCLLIFAFTSLYAQDEFMIYGKVRLPDGSADSIKAVAKSETTVDFNKTEYLSGKGEFRFFFKYGDEYTLSFEKDGYIPVEIPVSTVFPENVEQCCQTPLELNMHLFEPGSEFDSIFDTNFIIIQYDDKYRGYNYDIDPDYIVQKMLVEAALNKQQKIYDIVRRKEIADSMAVENDYLQLINAGNLFFANKHWAEAKQMFLKALELKPGRRYPKYKLEDIRTAVELFNKENDTAQINLDSVFAPVAVPVRNEPRKFVYTPPSDEELERRLHNDIVAQIVKESANDSIAKQRISFIASVLDTPLEPKSIAVIKSIAEKATIQSFEPIQKNTEEKKELPELENKTDSIGTEKPIVVAEQSKPLRQSKPEAVFDKVAYQDSLCAKYPGYKTVEVTEDLYKKTTRVFIHKDNRVDIYMKVEHAWGGVFYFIDRTPLVPENISQSYFESVTRSIDANEINGN